MFMRIPNLADLADVSFRGPTKSIELEGKADTVVLSGDGGGTWGQVETVGL